MAGTGFVGMAAFLAAKPREGGAGKGCCHGLNRGFAKANSGDRPSKLIPTDSIG
jgi:hypothetical protein